MVPKLPDRPGHQRNLLKRTQATPHVDEDETVWVGACAWVTSRVGAPAAYVKVTVCVCDTASSYSSDTR